jgi:hypothetical protein
MKDEVRSERLVKRSQIAIRCKMLFNGGLEVDDQDEARGMRSGLCRRCCVDKSKSRRVRVVDET